MGAGARLEARRNRLRTARDDREQAVSHVYNLGRRPHLITQ